MASNILLLTIDCLRADRINHQRRSGVLPTIDELQDKGLCFEAAYSTGPWTAESFPGILAGRLAEHCQYQKDVKFKALPSQSSTIASHLALF